LDEAISIHLDGAQPFVAGQHVTGTVMFNNTLEKGVKFQRIYAEFVGEVIYATTEYNASGYYSIAHHEPFFRQLINLEEKQDNFILQSGYFSLPMSFSLPSFLPPSLNRLSTHDPYVCYKIRVVLERPEKHEMNIHRDFPVLIITSPSSYSHPSHFPAEAENTNRNDVTVHAALADRNASFAPGDNFLLDIELHNPNHNTIKSLSIDLIQHRTVAMGKDCKQTIPLLDLLHLREFSGENHHETLKLTIPDDDRIIPSFYYRYPTFSEKPIAVEYTLELGVKTHGFCKDIILNIPIVLHSREVYMAPPNEEEAAPPSYDFAIASH